MSGMQVRRYNTGKTLSVAAAGRSVPQARQGDGTPEDRSPDE
jgi:hypothetical protein